MGLSTAAERERFQAAAGRPNSWLWLDEQGRGCAREAASMVRLRKVSTGPSGRAGFLSVVVDAGEFATFAPDEARS